MPLSDAEKRWYDSLRNTGTQAPESRFVTPPAKREERKSRLAQAKDFGGKLADIAFSGKTAVSAVLPGVEREDLDRLPGPLEFALDNLLSPVGLASIALTPFTGGASIAAKVGLGTALSRSPLLVRGGVELAGRAGVDLLAAGMATGAAKVVNEALPEDIDPTVRTIASMAAGLVVGGTTGSAISRSVRPSVATAGTTYAEAVQRSGNFLPTMKPLGEVADEVQTLGKWAQTPGIKQSIELVNPSQLVTTDIGRITVAEGIQKARIEEAVKLTVAAGFPDNFGKFRIKDGKALVQGERVPWKEAFDRPLTPELDEQVVKFKSYVGEAVEKYNAANPNSTIDGTWVPEFNNHNKLIKPDNPANNALFQEAKALELRKVPLDSPEAVLHIYGRAALKAELDADYKDILGPILVDADKVLAATPEGKPIYEAAQNALNSRKALRARIKELNATPGRDKRLGEHPDVAAIRKQIKEGDEAVRAWSQYRQHTIATEAPKTLWHPAKIAEPVNTTGDPALLQTLNDLELERGSLKLDLPPVKALEARVERVNRAQMASITKVPFIENFDEAYDSALNSTYIAASNAAKARQDYADLTRSVFNVDTSLPPAEQLRLIVDNQNAVKWAKHALNNAENQYTSSLAKLKKESDRIHTLARNTRTDKQKQVIADAMKQNDELVAAKSAAKVEFETASEEVTKRIEEHKARLTELQAKITEARKNYEASIPAPVKRTPDELVPVSKYKGGYLIDMDRNTVEKLQEWNSRFLPGGPNNGFLNAAQQTNDAARYFSASLDFSGAFINLLPVLFTDPIAWGKAVAANWRTAFQPSFQTKYISQNYDSLLEMIKNGVPGGDIELFSSARRGGLAGRILDTPGVKQTAGAAFNRVQGGYETGLLIGRHELWKALKSDPNYGGDLRRVAKTVRNFTGGLDTATLGVGRTQRAIESVLFFSPKMFRSILAMGADAMRPWTPEGAQSAHTIFRMMAAGTGLFGLANVALGIMEGDSEEEVMKRLDDSMNPINGRQFGAIRVGDDWYGIGGQVRAMSQLMARAISDEDEKAGRDNNPFYEFFSGRLGPAPRSGLAAIEAATNGDTDTLPYDLVENPIDWAKLSATSFLPFYAQNMLEEGVDPRNLIDVVGLQSKPRSASDVLNSESWQRYNRKWADLTDAEQETLRQENPEVVKKAKEFGSADERGYKAAVERNDEEARQSLIALNNAGLTPDDFKARAEEVLRDRWISNKEARDNFNIIFEGESADSPKRGVMDAYFKTFDDATIPGTVNQTDWDYWEELQSDLDKRIANGEFGPPARAQQFLDERRRFELPEEVQWFQDAKDVIRASGYWDQTDIAFDQFANLVKRIDPEIDNTRELDQAINEALEAGDRGHAVRLNNLRNYITKKSTQLRKVMRTRDKELRTALELTGVVEKKI